MEKMVNVFNCANVFILLFIGICKVQENQCSICKIEINGYGKDDPSGHEVYIKLNNKISYMRSEFLGFPESAIRGFHLAFVNIRNCNLVVDPVVCGTHNQESGSNCVVSYIGQYANMMEDVFLLLSTGKGPSHQSVQ